MADGGVSRSGSEQDKLGQSVRTQQKYGTAARTPCAAATPDLFVKHYVQQDETLAGIALKYGLSIHQLKSVNNLWSDWQLGVCDFILVPVSSANEHCCPSSCSGMNNGDVPASGHSATRELVTRQELNARNKIPKSMSAGDVCNAATTSTVCTVNTQTSYTSTSSVQDYFSKYDVSLEKIKENVNRMEETMNSRLDSHNPLLMLPHQRHLNGRSSGSATWQTEVEALDPLREPELRFSADRDSGLLPGATSVNLAHSVGRPASKPCVPSQTASQRLQRTYDDLFQL